MTAPKIRGLFNTDLLKVQKLVQSAYTGKFKMRQQGDQVEVKLVNDAGVEEHWLIGIVDAPPLDPSEYHQHELGYMHLWSDKNNSCPDHHPRPTP